MYFATEFITEYVCVHVVYMFRFTLLILTPCCITQLSLFLYRCYVVVKYVEQKANHSHYKLRDAGAYDISFLARSSKSLLLTLNMSHMTFSFCSFVAVFK